LKISEEVLFSNRSFVQENKMKQYIFLATVLLTISATAAYAGLFSFGVGNGATGAGASGFGTSGIAGSSNDNNTAVTDDDQARSGAIDVDKQTAVSDTSTQQQ
jgi:hypothetical protein